eukprot:11123947-Alexandrium_andersonii.AAC.1
MCIRDSPKQPVGPVAPPPRAQEVAAGPARGQAARAPAEATAAAVGAGRLGPTREGSGADLQA